MTVHRGAFSFHGSLLNAPIADVNSLARQGFAGSTAFGSSTAVFSKPLSLIMPKLRCKQLAITDFRGSKPGAPTAGHFASLANLPEAFNFGLF